MINLNQFTLNNEGVKDLNEVLFTTAFKQSGLWNTATPKAGVKNGKKLDFVDSMGDLGLAGRGCNPTYSAVEIKGLEKTWALGDWSSAKKLCYDNLKNTIAEYGMRTGTEADNIEGTEFYNKILLPLYNKAIEDMYWRMAWFGDTAAKNVSASGTITNGVEVNLFKMADGLFKRLFAIASADSTKHTTITANSAASYALQKSGIKTQGAALAVVDNLLSDADARIAEQEGAVILMTNSLYQALRKDYALKYNATIPFREVADGMKLPTYDGIAIHVVSEWDTAIKKFEDNGTTLNLPHRAVFTSINNLFVGTEDKDVFSELSVKFDDITRANYMYVASNIGTLVAEDDLVQIAY